MKRLGSDIYVLVYREKKDFNVYFFVVETNTTLYDCPDNNEGDIEYNLLYN